MLQHNARSVIALEIACLVLNKATGTEAVSDHCVTAESAKESGKVASVCLVLKAEKLFLVGGSH